MVEDDYFLTVKVFGAGGQEKLEDISSTLSMGPNVLNKADKKASRIPRESQKRPVSFRSVVDGRLSV